ncbi:hypothetical protein [Methanoregula sp.]|uniref:hypothetical protein n=1 Tax=Methanoregula sp. TaxID=2052170 RepID=UPI003C70C83B
MKLTLPKTTMKKTGEAMNKKNPNEYRLPEKRKSANANESVRRITDPPMAENISSPLEKMIPITPNNIPTKKKSSIQGR